MGSGCLKDVLEGIYATYNRPEWISPDPLECVLPFREVLDREIAALAASGLAYGRVRQILKSVGPVLDAMGPSPRAYLERKSRSALERDFSCFRHRFTAGEDLVALLWGARQLCLVHGGLEAAFLSYDGGGGDYRLALDGFLEELSAAGGGPAKNSLVCRPSDGSACKRHWLFLKWMVRSDEVDPGGWDSCDPGRLLVPLDTHMHRIGRTLGFTGRKAADLKTALEVTRGFARIVPGDPARYDFCLTRFGIRDDLAFSSLLDKCRAASVDIHETQDQHPGDEKEGKRKGPIPRRARRLEDDPEKHGACHPGKLA